MFVQQICASTVCITQTNLFLDLRTSLLAGKVSRAKSRAHCPRATVSHGPSRGPSVRGPSRGTGRRPSRGQSVLRGGLRAGQVSTGQVASGQVAAGPVATGQVAVGKVAAGQVAGQVCRGASGCLCRVQSSTIQSNPVKSSPVKPSSVKSSPAKSISVQSKSVQSRFAHVVAHAKSTGLLESSPVQPCLHILLHIPIPSADSTGRVCRSRRPAAEGGGGVLTGRKSRKQNQRAQQARKASKANKHTVSATRRGEKTNAMQAGKPAKQASKARKPSRQASKGS